MYCLKDITNVKVLKKVKLQDQGHRVKNCWYIPKGLATIKFHVKNQSPALYCSKIIAMVEEGQGHKVKTVGTHKKVLSYKLLT